MAEIIKRYPCEKRNISVVRRITGGGVVIHGQDLTFSLAVKSSNPFFSGVAKNSYLKVNEALRVGLKTLYPKIDYVDCKNIPSGRGGGDRVCFETPTCYDLLLDGKKIVGASQRRKKGAILHQSSVFLEGDRRNLILQILEGFKETWKIIFLEKSLSDEELMTAKEKANERYRAKEWAYFGDLERSFFS